MFVQLPGFQTPYLSAGCFRQRTFRNQNDTLWLELEQLDDALPDPGNDVGQIVAFVMVVVGVVGGVAGGGTAIDACPFGGSRIFGVRFLDDPDDLGQPDPLFVDGIGSDTTTLKIDGNQFLGIDLNAAAGRHLDVTLSSTPEGLNVAVTPSLEVAVALGFHFLADQITDLPTWAMDDTLTIARCEPQKLSVVDELRSFLGYDIRVMVATEADILKGLDRYYAAGGESVEDLIAGMEDNKELAEAAATFAEILEKDPPTELAVEAAMVRGRALERLDRMDPALAMYDLVVDKYPDAKQHPDALLAAAKLMV